MKAILSILNLLFLISCHEKDINNTPDKSNEYIKYLEEYQKIALEDDLRDIKFEQIGGNIYWITNYHGAGTRQEYFWVNQGNRLIPKFIFEYGGENWDEHLNYTFISIDNGDTLVGQGEEKEILIKKKEYIKSMKGNN